ncbi:hypothetical protein P261_00749 [Lachnospiraceae bacterium TWA4]|nr:hypothetical protein P261_00749 [Lachnospiraceae bacterium TWA4]
MYSKLSIYEVISNGGFLILLSICSIPIIKKKLPFGVQAVFSLLLLGMSLAFLAGDSYNPFLYFRF